MKNREEIARELLNAVEHTMGSKGPSTVHLSGQHGKEDGCVVFVMPPAVGDIIDDALEKLYALLGWRVQKQGRGETH